MSALTITELNSIALIQDFGRFNHQNQGISVNGAADEYAFLKANQLVGNPLFNADNNKQNSQCASIEVFYGQLTFFTDVDCTIAITGANCTPVKVTISGEHKPLTMWQSHLLRAGESVELLRPTSGVISYVAVNGGIQTECFLNSRSQNIVPNANLPSLAPLTKGTELALSATCQQQSTSTRLDLTKYKPENFYPNAPLTLRFIPHQQWFDAPKHQQQSFQQLMFTINSQSNRMAYQFDVTEEQTTGCFEQLSQALSSAVNFGTIQLLPSGLPVVLMKDRQTMGGYPTLGSVFQVDLFRLSQLPPGEKVRFKPADITQAQSQLNAFYQKFMQQ
ncbi:biotin-dependent carboxyltransferase family protein [Thalassotalea sp. LPB0316]|uniref:5-oxoprolinase subunit C family protein n=1 Tax=Thalassotalea sp. LPB0316 TaxID=2769490 RepID=UPI0018684663|nr:biotin-dependent carboxyltransferase family protein [Thalassotalea sp. LPB0316]QOL26084.1 biotin-dependent carboxyltransferase family protein [Thalassotalea sp. LPB0316]